MDISIKLKELRKENKLTQQQIADVLNVSRVVYNRYENNQREIPITLLIKLADFYKETLDYICGRDI
jgi:transcriptional regulator with XRE-family HTH domain